MRCETQRHCELAKPMTRTNPGTPEPSDAEAEADRRHLNPAGGVADGENATVKVDRTAQAGGQIVARRRPLPKRSS